MDLIPGLSLAEKLGGKPLPGKEILRLGMQLAEGLTAAHAEGVVHRDLKPGNLRVTPDGRLKILDFGLARLLQPGGVGAAETLTETQTVAGTLPYMPPEQLRCERVDNHSDLCAAGAVLYEMATGRRAFPETQGPKLVDAIFHHQPPAPGISAGLDGILLKRPVSRRRVLFIGGAVAAVLVVAVVLRVGGRGVGRVESLAVLPLENLSRDPQQDYFTDGMTEALNLFSRRKG